MNNSATAAFPSHPVSTLLSILILRFPLSWQYHSSFITQNSSVLATAFPISAIRHALCPTTPNPELLTPHPEPRTPNPAGFSPATSYLIIAMKSEAGTENLIKRISAHIQEFDVSFALLYGSVAAGTQTALSDYDIAVFCDDQDVFIALLNSLLGEFPGLPIDLTNLKGLSSVDYYEIVSRAKILFIRDRRLYDTRKLKTMREYLDFAGTR
ncbi:MAG: nucleotidyltransferase domain-containing protein, partial [Bacteroidetes bacterium]|nr:nucleotidyltransferase domain-containing protein [Bacteroidota bacterium]